MIICLIYKPVQLTLVHFNSVANKGTGMSTLQILAIVFGVVQG